jgi:hypothetical protein
MHIFQFNCSGRKRLLFYGRLLMLKGEGRKGAIKLMFVNS